MPKVSIILTTHGAAPYLKQAIGSVLAQTFEDWECIVAMDGVFDTSHTFLDCDNRIRLIEYMNTPDVPCRFAYTINRAVRKEAQGDYITYLCHDDLYLPWRLERMVSGIKGYHRDPVLREPLDIVFGWQKLINESGDFTPHEGFRRGNPDQPAGSVDHSSVMHRRECFERVGGWDEAAPARYGDAYFWARLQKAGYKFHCIPEVLDVHRFNQHSITWQIDHPQEVVANG